MRTTPEDIENIIGDVDDFTQERILAVGASPEELKAATLTALLDYEMGEQVCPPANARVEKLCAIVEELLAQENARFAAEDLHQSRRGRYDSR